MHDASKALGTFCAGDKLLEKSECHLHSMKRVPSQARSESGFYQIVPDGKLFAIAVQGEVVVHGLDPEDLPKARGIVEILNRFVKAEKAG